MVKFQKVFILIFSIITCTASIYLGIIEDLGEAVFAMSLPIGLYVIRQKGTHLADVLSVINGIFCAFGVYFFWVFIKGITGMTSSFGQDIIFVSLGILIGILVGRFGTAMNK